MENMNVNFASNTDACTRVLALVPEAIEISFPRVAKRLMRAKDISLETGSRERRISDGVFYRHWPFCLMKLHADGCENLWLPLGREYKPLGCEQDGYYDYERYGHLAWQFTCDPREVEGGWRMIQDDRVFLYRDHEMGRLRDHEDYLRCVGRLIAAGTGENAIIYAGRLLSNLPKK
jgi:hypothetical protein